MTVESAGMLEWKTLDFLWYYFRRITFLRFITMRFVGFLMLVDDPKTAASDLACEHFYIPVFSLQKYAPLKQE